MVYLPVFEDLFHVQIKRSHSGPSLVHFVNHFELGLCISALLDGSLDDVLGVLLTHAERLVDALHAREFLVDDGDVVGKSILEFNDALVQGIPALLVFDVIGTGSVLDNLALLFNGGEKILDGFLCLVEDLVERLLLATVRVSKRRALVSNLLNKFEKAVEFAGHVIGRDGLERSGSLKTKGTEPQ